MLLQLIPPGRVISYKELSHALGVHPRVVGRLLALNDEPIVIPCHRVVMSDGRLGGYSGAGGVSFKKRLLEMEGVKLVNGKVKKECFMSLRVLLET